MSTLRVERVSKHFGGLQAVCDFTMEISSGRIVGLIGPNGAGKSTVVNLITGVLTISSGRVLLDDFDLTAAPPHEIARAGVARTFQNIRLLEEASVLDNVLIGFHTRQRASLLAGLAGLPSARRETARLREEAWQLLKRFAMSDFADHPAGGLSYGHQRRVEMMRAVAGGPSVLLLDEPVAGMNEVESGELAQIFLELASGGMGLMLIEHNVRFVAELCSQTYVLNVGRMIASGPPEVVMDDPAVIEAYLGTRRC